MTTRRVALATTLGVAVGFLAVRVLASPTRARAAVVIPHAPADLRCVDVADRTEFIDACPDIRDEAAACDEALAAATTAHPTTRLGFPAMVSEAEQPGPWTDAVSAALASCGLDSAFEVADCDEYPCMAALRAPPGGDDAFKAALKACPALEKFDTSEVLVHCPDGSVETAQVLDNADYDEWDKVDVENGAAAITGGGAVERVLAAGRRLESVTQMWECNARPR